MTKPTKWPVHPAKTQISLCMCIVWSEYSLCAQREDKDTRFLQVDSEDPYQYLSLRWAHMPFCWFCHAVAHMMAILFNPSNKNWNEPGHEKTCLMSYANNKGADEPAHPRSLISTFVVRCLDSVMSLVSVTKILSLMLASLAEQASLSLTWLETPEDTHSHDEAQMHFKGMEMPKAEMSHVMSLCKRACTAI